MSYKLNLKNQGYRAARLELRRREQRARVASKPKPRIPFIDPANTDIKIISNVS